LSSTRDSNVSANVRMRAYALMANAWYDFDVGMPVTPYVGGGIGMALIQMDGKLDGISLHEKNDTVFAWQVGAGLAYPLSAHTKLTLDYRYFSAGGAHLRIEPGFNGGNITEDYNAHSVLVGLRFDL
jgi:opacity protein-like surface antigen